ncbi:MAG: laminin G domain-containing protein [Planctomycetota bacterium]
MYGKRYWSNSLASLGASFNIVRSYGLDGFCKGLDQGVAWHGLSCYEMMSKLDMEGMTFLPLIGHPGATKEKGIIIEKALASPHATRINGKLLIGGYYRTDRPSYSSKEWKHTLDALRTKYGDRMYFLVEFHHTLTDMWRIPYQIRRRGRITYETRNQIRNDLRRYLDVFDGGVLYYRMNQLRTLDGKFDQTAFTDHILPIIKDVFDEPEYRNKIFGLGATVGYFNMKTSGLLDEDGTKTLRRTFEASMSANPDLILMPEWNEQRENTFIQPSIAKGLTTQRIIKYYTDRVKDIPLSPYKNENVSIPNLVVSYRRHLILGEKLEIELLNIPDSTFAEPYEVILSLEEPNERVIHRFPPVKLDPILLHDQTYAAATEKFAQHPVLTPSVEVVQANGKRHVFKKGLRYIQLSPTWNRDWLYAKHAVRDIAPVSHCSLKADKLPDDRLQLNGTVECDEQIASVSIMENGSVVYGMDPSGRYNDLQDLPLSITMSTLKPRNVSGRITIENGTMRVPWRRSFLRRVAVAGNNTIEFRNRRIGHWSYRHGSIVFIPRDCLDKAVLDIDLNVIKRRVPLASIAANGVYGITADKAFTLLLEDYSDVAPNIYPHLDKKQVTFQFQHKPVGPYSAFHVQVVTKNGHIYRAAPLQYAVITGRSSERMVWLRVFSYTQDKPVQVQVQSSRIPDLRFDFWGRCGDMLPSATSRIWHGKFGFVELYHPYLQRELPADFSDTAPEWVSHDGVICLEFDGNCDYILFPQEALPRGCFSLSFEIKLQDKSDQGLFVHGGHWDGCLELWIKNGKLGGVYRRQVSSEEDAIFWKVISLKTGLTVPVGKWVKIEVRYDLKNIVLSVDGRRSIPFPCSRRGILFQPCAFGGPLYENNDKTQHWFRGYLKSIRIQHHP